MIHPRCDIAFCPMHAKDSIIHNRFISFHIYKHSFTNAFAYIFIGCPPAFCERTTIFFAVDGYRKCRGDCRIVLHRYRDVQIIASLAVHRYTLTIVSDSYLSIIMKIHRTPNSIDSPLWSSDCNCLIRSTNTIRE